MSCHKTRQQSGSFVSKFATNIYTRLSDDSGKTLMTKPARYFKRNWIDCGPGWGQKNVTQTTADDKATLQYRVAFVVTYANFHTVYYNLTSQEIDEGINEVLKANWRVYICWSGLCVHSSDINVSPNPLKTRQDSTSPDTLWFSQPLCQFKLVYRNSLVSKICQQRQKQKS
jgi:hypothetical protein